jgi:hypothetical protein
VTPSLVVFPSDVPSVVTAVDRDESAVLPSTVEFVVLNRDVEIETPDSVQERAISPSVAVSFVTPDVDLSSMPTQDLAPATGSGTLVPELAAGSAQLPEPARASLPATASIEAVRPAPGAAAVAGGNVVAPASLTNAVRPVVGPGQLGRLPSTGGAPVELLIPLLLVGAGLYLRRRTRA